MVGPSWPRLSRGRAVAPPRGWWPGGPASVSEAGGPGLGSSLARALRCVSARSESFLFNSLYFPRVSKSVSLLESKFGLMGAFVTFWDNDAGSKTHVLAAGRGPRRRSQAGGQRPGGADAAGQNHMKGALPLGLCGLSRLGHFRARLFFRGLDPGCRAMFFVAAPWFSTSSSRLSEHFRDRNALGFARRRTCKLVGRAATQLNANSKSSPSR